MNEKQIIYSFLIAVALYASAINNLGASIEETGVVTSLSKSEIQSNQKALDDVMQELAYLYKTDTTAE